MSKKLEHAAQNVSYNAATTGQPPSAEEDHVKSRQQLLTWTFWPDYLVNNCLEGRKQTLKHKIVTYACCV